MELLKNKNIWTIFHTSYEESMYGTERITTMSGCIDICLPNYLIINMISGTINVLYCWKTKFFSLCMSK